MDEEHDDLPFAKICTVAVNVEGEVSIDIDGWLSMLPDVEAHAFLRLAAEAMRDMAEELPEPEQGAKIVSIARVYGTGEDSLPRGPGGVSLACN